MAQSNNHGNKYKLYTTTKEYKKNRCSIKGKMDKFTS